MEEVLPYYFQNILFCVQQNKETHTGLEQLSDNFLFWGSYPFKAEKSLTNGHS